MTTQQVDPLRACKDARDEREAVASKLRQAGEFYGEVAGGLLDPEICLILANSDLSTPIDLPHDRSVDYKAWPSREEVKELLAEYYAAHKRFGAAYHALEPDERTLFDGSRSKPQGRSLRTTRMRSV